MVKEWTVETNSTTETWELAFHLGQLLRGGEVLTLSGDLGAGKTTFTQGLARALGVERNVNSPTFTLIKEYQGRKYTLYHMDAYRLEDEDEALGFEEYFAAQGVCVIEWPQKIQRQLPPERLEVEIQKFGETKRYFSFFPLGAYYEQLVNKLVKR